MTNLELIEYAKKFKIPHFRGVFMRNELSSMTPHRYETGIINLDSTSGSGTHWVAYSKKNSRVVYSDSFGLRPPPEVKRYFAGNQLLYNNNRIQKFDSSNCGKLCLLFLIKEAKT